MIIILFFFNIFNLQLIKSEECELPVGCESKEFPYYLCDYDKIVTVCTANPYNEYDNQTLLKIYEAFKLSNYEEFPHVLFRDIVINEERIIKALSK